MKSSRKNSVLGHFYASVSKLGFQCQVVGEKGKICGQLYMKSGGGRARNNHLLNHHPRLSSAVREFRTYQCMVRGIELPPELEDDDVPSTPKKSKFSIVRDEFLHENMKQPLPYELENFVDLIIKMIAIDGASFSLFSSDRSKALCGLLNPLFK
ncbi:hypothetical protein BGZ49_005557, partial [Haplosporangium sp. Z 27]